MPVEYFEHISQQTQNICITFIQRRPNVFDVGPTLYKCYTNLLCLLGCSEQILRGRMMQYQLHGVILLHASTSLLCTGRRTGARGSHAVRYTHGIVTTIEHEAVML